MKNPLILLMLSSVVLFGCTQKEIPRPQILLSGISSQENIQAPKEINLTGDFSSVSAVSGVISLITFSGKSLIYNGLFSIDVPAGTKQREYLVQNNGGANIASDWIECMDTDPYTSFSLRARRLSSGDQGIGTKTLCSHDYGERLDDLSKSTILIGNTEVYITDIKLPSEGLGVAPRISQQRALCFVYSGSLFSFSLVDYSKQEMQNGLHSLKFY